MKSALLTLAGVAVVVIAAIIVPRQIPVDRYKDRILAAVSSQTGYDLTISGPISVALLPAVGLEARNVRIAGSGDLAAAQEVDVELALLPLLSGRIEVDRVVLHGAEIALTVDAAGAANWRPASPVSKAASSPGGSGAGMPLRLGVIEIDGGTLAYRNARTAFALAIDDVAGTLTVAGPELPVDVALSGRYRDAPFTIEAHANRARALVDDDETGVHLVLDSDLLGRVQYDGRVRGALAGSEGTLAIELDDVAALGTLAGIVAMPAIRTATLSGSLDLAGQRVALNPATLEVDERSATGSLALEFGGSRPRLLGALEADRMDLNGYIPDAADAAVIDLAPLQRFDGEGTLKLAGIVVRGVELGASTMNIGLKEGRLSIGIGETPLFDGAISGQLTTDTRAPVPTFGLTLHLDGIDVGDLAKRFAGTDRVAGLVRGDAAVHVEGRDFATLIASYSGDASLSVTDGVVHGLDMVAGLRTAAGTPEPVGDASQAADRQTAVTIPSSRLHFDKSRVQIDPLTVTAPEFNATGQLAVTVAGSGVAGQFEVVLDPAAPRPVALSLGVGGTLAAPTLQPVAVAPPAAAPPAAPPVAVAPVAVPAPVTPVAAPPAAAAASPHAVAPHKGTAHPARGKPAAPRKPPHRAHRPAPAPP
ncbi:MAG: AsmA family protein [Azospirillaceae bacterium]|nr:AsmA family protein [Azospirillaceae bacterium]